MRNFFARSMVVWVLVGLGVCAFIARFWLVGAEMWGHPDVGYFYDGAEELMRTGGLSDYYYAVFPYMTGYVGLLSVFFGWLGVRGLAVVVLNALLEVVGVVALYFLVRGVSGSRWVGVCAGAVWLLNPFHFVFSGLAMPVVAFDSMLIVCVLAVWLMWRERKNLIKFLGYSSLLGVVLAVAGWFRPTASVLLVALGLFYLWGLVREKFQGWWVVLLGLAVVGGVFWGVGRLQIAYAERVTGEIGLGNYAGWSAYVGSSEANDGGWNEADAKVFWDDYLLNGYSIEEANAAVMGLGLERYAERGLLGNVGFLGAKVRRLAGDVPDVGRYFAGGWGWGADAVYVWGWVWVGLCVAMFLVGVWRGRKVLLCGGVLLFVVLGVLGMFSSGLLVEVMNRYAIPILAMMFMVGVLWYDKDGRGA